MVYQLLKVYITLGLHIFFKKIKVVNSNNIPKSGPILFVPNHQNALLDALLVVTHNKRKTHFLARADAFKFKIFKRGLSYLKMLPVYRIRDGFSSINQNEAIFERCYEILNKGECVCIFPEGNHDLKRRLRPLSKGFTRIVIGALDNNPDMNLKIVPVGLNYTDHQSFHGSVSIYFGEPIDAKKYYTRDFNTDSKLIKKEVSNALKKLIVHIEDLDIYNEKMALIKSHKVDLLDPKFCNEFISKEHGQSRTENESYTLVLKLVGNIIALVNVVPLSLWNSFLKKIKDPVMIGTFKFCYGVFLFPIISLLIATIAGLVINIWIGLGYLLLITFTSPFLAARSILKH